jgi:hypothetical protein
MAVVGVLLGLGCGFRFGGLGFVGAVMPWSWFFCKSQPTKPAASLGIKFPELEFRPVAEKTSNNAKPSCAALELPGAAPQLSSRPCAPASAPETSLNLHGGGPLRHIEKRYNILNNDISRNDMLLAQISGNCRKDKDYVMDVDKKDRNEILVAMIIYTLMLVLLGRRLLDLVIWHRIPHSFGVLLAERADEGMIPLSLADSVAKSLLISGFLLSLLGIVVVATTLILLARQLLKGQFFTAYNVKCFTIGSLSLGVYFLGVFVQNMGANEMAAKLNLRSWFDYSEAQSLDYIAMFLFVETLVLLAVVIRRGISMQEDQEGLI